MMYLGIDLGTSSVKLVLMDEHFKVVTVKEEPLLLSHPKPGYSEQDPKAWWLKTKKAILSLSLSHRKKIQAIGLSGQMHGAVLLDEKGRVLRPAILWNDGRSFEECHLLEKRAPRYKSITLNSIMPGFTAPKLLWVKKHEPQIFKKVKKVLLPKDYIRLHLTGEYATDMSDASGTCWLNIKKRAWSDEMLEATHLKEKHMPELFEGSQPTGKISKAMARAFKLSEEVIVAGGGGDNAASAVGMGIVKPDEGFISLGTSGVYFVPCLKSALKFQKGVHTFCHALENTWHQMTVHLSAASSLSWFSDLFDLKIDQMLLLAKKKKETDVIFLPYLSGERSPMNDVKARGVFFHLSHLTKKADLALAVLEGVALAFADGGDYMTKRKLKEVAILGGGSKSEYWSQIMASIVGQKLTYRDHASLGAGLGAAKLAYLSTHPKSKLTKPKKLKTISPKNSKKYEKKKALFKSLYPALKGAYHA